MSAENLPLPRPPRNDHPNTIPYIDEDGEYKYYEMKDGELIIGATGDAPMLGSLTAGTNVTITNGPGTITINAAAGSSTSITGTANQVLANGTSGTPQTGPVTLSLPQSIDTAALPQFNSLGLGAAASATRGQIALAGSTSGVVTLAAGATPSTYTFTLPSSAGANGQYLATNGSGTTAWTTPGFQVYVDSKPVTTTGGASAGAAWQTRTLNTASSGNLDGTSTTLAANVITFVVAGTYTIRASAPGYRVANTQIRIWSVTAGTSLVVGTSEYTGAALAPGVTVRSIVEYGGAIAAGTQIRIEQYTQAVNADGLGVAANNGTSEIYTVVQISKLL